MPDFVAYEKSIEAKHVVTTHTVRFKLNWTSNEVISAINNVPPSAVLTMVVGDDENNDVGELIFSEDKVVG